MPTTKLSHAAVAGKDTTAAAASPSHSKHNNNTTGSANNSNNGTTTRRSGWSFFHRGNNNSNNHNHTNRKSNHNNNNAAAVTHDNTPKTNNRSAVAAAAATGKHHLYESTNTTNATTTTTSSSLSTMTHTTGINNNHNYYSNTPTVSGILKKETTDFDAIIASKRFRELNKNTSWLCRTKYFHKLCHMAFDSIDSDHSGQIDEKELYAGLLLIHLQLGMYAGPAACRPLSRDQVHTIFIKMDTDHSGTLNVTEFETVMSVLFSNVLLRVIVQWSMTIMIVPWLAQFILSCIITVISYSTAIITNLDEHSSFFNVLELTIEGLFNFIYTTMVPNLMKIIFRTVQRTIVMIPISIWKALPLTLLSTILGIVVVPYCIFQIDHYFQTIADRHQQRQNQHHHHHHPYDAPPTTIDKSKSV